MSARMLGPMEDPTQRERRYHPDGETPRKGEIFCFGSNRAGRHGAGSALVAYERFGAKIGIGEGLVGQSYAIPTKGYKLEVLSLDEIREHVDRFIAFASANPELEFYLTRIGCGLAGYKDEQVAPLFTEAPMNCILPLNWQRWV